MNDKSTTVTLPLISINRHRIGMDGEGVTTLVGSFGCPLKCRYCINPEAWSQGTACHPVTPEELLEKVQIDHLYFLATGGGITFGGGESLLHADFIREFRRICPPEWKLTVETSLNVPSENVKKVLDAVDAYIVDIKDFNPDIYRSYTGTDNAQVIDNLQLLRKHISPKRIRVRVPLIPHFNQKEDMEHSIRSLQNMGFTDIDAFSYVLRKSTT